MKKLESAVTGRNFAKGMCAAVGIVAAILIVKKKRKKIREGAKNRTSTVTVTIEVCDIDRLLIERIE